MTLEALEVLKRQTRKDLAKLDDGKATLGEKMKYEHDEGVNIKHWTVAGLYTAGVLGLAATVIGVGGLLDAFWVGMITFAATVVGAVAEKQGRSEVKRHATAYNFLSPYLVRAQATSRATQEKIEKMPRPRRASDANLEKVWGEIDREVANRVLEVEQALIDYGIRKDKADFTIHDDGLDTPALTAAATKPSVSEK